MPSWIKHVIVLDGMLPAAIWIAPIVVRLSVPNHRGPVEVIAVMFPIFAFLIRAQLGRRSIQLNSCGTRMQTIQRMALATGLLLLVPVDAIIILSHIMPPNAAFATPEDIFVWTVLFFGYIVAMSIAMYPGPKQRIIVPSSTKKEQFVADNDLRQPHKTD